MKKITFIFLISISFTAYAQTNIKWEETFNDTTIPAGWSVVDNDNSGSGLDLFQSINLAGATVLPQAGQSFWASNYQNANLAGVIDEWLISPQISVIYSGDRLYFWAGAVGGPFDDSLRVWVSTTNQQLSSFTHLVGYFKVDGPAGSWHKYGFDLSPFDSSDIYFAINYYIQDGGSGGQHSDFVWIDHFIVTGDPSTINTPPTDFYLLNPPNASFLHPQEDSTIHLRWTAASDADGDTLRYRLKILDVFPQLIFSNILDTTFAFDWHGMLNHYAAYRWTASVTDGKSTVASPDTFFFVTPPIYNVAPFPFTLINPPDGDTLSISDTLLFKWHKAVDPNSDTLSYALNITGSNLDTTFSAIADTTFSLYGAAILQESHTYSWKVMASDIQYTTPSSNIWSFFTKGAVGIAYYGSIIPDQPALYQNYPNPFNPTTTISYSLGGPPSEQLSAFSDVELSIYNLSGQKVATLVSEKQPAGKYEVHWDASGMASGVYLYRLSTDQGFSQTRKLILLK